MSPVQNDIQALQSAIMEEARQEANQILAEAQAQAESIHQQAQTQADAEREAILQQAHEKTKAIHKHTVAAAQLEAQRLRLERREQLLQQVLASARQRLGSVPQQPDYEQIVKRLVREAAAHLGTDEALVRAGQHEAARMWRQSLSERVREEADHYLTRLAQLQRKYAMRMPTVAHRLGERFLRPLEVDRICALVAPAMEEAHCPGPRETFDLLARETEDLTREPTGVGLDTPPWLAALEEEVDRKRRSAHEKEKERQLSKWVPRARLTWGRIHRQIERLAARD